MSITSKYYLLKNEEDLSGNCGIMLSVSCKGERIRIRLGEKIKKKEWNERQQRIRTTSTRQIYLNRYLEKIKADIQEIYAKAISDNKNISKAYLKNELTSLLHPTKVESKEFFDVLDQYIYNSEGIHAKATVTKTRTLKKHLLNFQKITKKDITFEDINLVFYESFYKYLVKQGITRNTIASYARKLKTFLKNCYDKGILKSNDYIKFKYMEKYENKPLALTKEEIRKIMDLRINGSHGKTRDVFVFLSLTGLRYSDLMQLKKENFQTIDGNHYLNSVTIKTRKFQNLPLNPIAYRIAEKYNFKLPKISDQKFNNYLKEIGEYAGINEPIQIVHYSGAKRIEQTKLKSEMLTSHVGRRSFASMMNENNIDIQTIMEFTGHKTLKAFRRYIGISEEHKINAINSLKL